MYDIQMMLQNIPVVNLASPLVEGIYNIIQMNQTSEHAIKRILNAIAQLLNQEYLKGSLDGRPKTSKSPRFNNAFQNIGRFMGSSGEKPIRALLLNMVLDNQNDNAVQECLKGEIFPEFLSDAPNEIRKKLLDKYHTSDARVVTDYTSSAFTLVFSQLTQDFLDEKINDDTLKLKIGYILAILVSTKEDINLVTREYFTARKVLDGIFEGSYKGILQDVNDTYSNTKIDNYNDATLAFPIYFNQFIDNLGDVEEKQKKLPIDAMCKEIWGEINQLLEHFDLKAVIEEMEWPKYSKEVNKLSSNLAIDVLKVLTITKLIIEDGPLITRGRNVYSQSTQERREFVKSLGNIAEVYDKHWKNGKISLILHAIFNNLPDQIKDKIKTYCTTPSGNLLQAAKNKMGFSLYEDIKKLIGMW